MLLFENSRGGSCRRTTAPAAGAAGGDHSIDGLASPRFRGEIRDHVLREGNRIPEMERWLNQPLDPIRSPVGAVGSSRTNGVGRRMRHYQTRCGRDPISSHGGGAPTIFWAGASAYKMVGAEARRGWVLFWHNTHSGQLRGRG